MEASPRRETNPNANPLSSPNSSTSSTNSNNNNNNNNVNGLLQAPPTTPTAQPPKPMTRSDSANPYPTTFVQADTSSFKQVVQMLTGSSETANKVVSSSKHDTRHNIPPIKFTPKKQQQQQHSNSGFKLYERRNNALKNLRLNPLIPIPVFNSNTNSNSGFSPRNPEILSPSILDFPALVLSPVTPLIPDPFDRSGTANFGHGCSQLNKEAEDKAIKEKGFYLHPSPSTTPRESEPPRLLPLFPTTSPRASGSSS
ncbi:VQ motif-containing protein 4 [Argentina anserina]|uniref:VQ motif-containing protein 4 n=1 Tax=Argentina anserina TaxID=57926 RepID=UPI0021766EB4|nr:VQ motif-containing protein 4 [Potentilla anserina]